MVQPQQQPVRAKAAKAPKAARISKLRNGLQRPNLRSWYDNVALHQNHTAKQLLKRIPHRGLGPKRDVSPFNPPQLLDAVSKLILP